MLPSLLGVERGLPASGCVGTPTSKAREPTVRVRSRHDVGELTGIWSNATSAASDTTFTSAIVAVGSMITSNIECSTGARSSSSAFVRRPGPKR